MAEVNNPSLIIEKEYIEFEFLDYDFSIIYEDGIFKAISYDEENDIIILEDKNNSIFYTEELELFGFLLTKEHFNILKEEIGISY